jgi:hypothetical protein
MLIVRLVLIGFLLGIGIYLGFMVMKWVTILLKR